jgi:glutamate synthase domain-containing protein 2
VIKTYLPGRFLAERDSGRCDRCGACIKQCSFNVFSQDGKDSQIESRHKNCVGCHRCIVFCPKGALNITRNRLEYRDNYNWCPEAIEDILRQAETGGVLLTSMGSDKAHRVYWDHMVLNASQVTNPSIDPLREPMELVTYLGRKPDRVELDSELRLMTKIPPQIKIELPVIFSAMSYGAVGLNVHYSLAGAAAEAGTLWNTGEGGLHPELYEYGHNTMVQVASGRFGVHDEYFDAARVVEIKIGQGAKPGIGGHLTGEKVSAEVSLTRMLPEGSDAISPAPHHDIYSIEDLAQLVSTLKEATHYKKPISVKIAAVHNVAAIASGVVRAGADIIVIDGLRGSTGAAPKIIRDNVGIPIEMALASVDNRLRQEQIRNRASIIVSGGIRNSGDVIKAIALGADAVAIGTAALVALGCHICQQCHTGKCAWGICTTNAALSRRLNPKTGRKRLLNLLHGWSMEIKDMLGGMGINALESLRGNRLHLRGIGLSDSELKTLGIKLAGG